MTILGIDYGRAKIGISIAASKIAEPYIVIRYHSTDEAIKKVIKVVKVEQVKKVVIGISEGEMGEEVKSFSLNLRERLKIPVEIFDETLSTQEAQRLAIEAGLGRKKRKSLEDAYSAALILQGYLDSI